uniref:Uncharacterized protein n=1 Tax=Anguilla anguilla TaxID=7936 RepID=A0A0E9P7S4_ANGAN
MLVLNGCMRHVHVVYNNNADTQCYNNNAFRFLLKIRSVFNVGLG